MVPASTVLLKPGRATLILSTGGHLYFSLEPGPSRARAKGGYLSLSRGYVARNGHPKRKMAPLSPIWYNMLLEPWTRFFAKDMHFATFFFFAGSAETGALSLSISDSG